MLIKGVLFDFDGTLTEPGSLDFSALRKAMGCPEGRPVLEFIEALPAEEPRSAARAILDDFERRAAENSRPNSGAEELLDYLRRRNVKVGILSRNSLRSILRALENFRGTRPEDFAVILSRDDPFVPKPSPEGIRAAADRMGVAPENLLVVGDFLFDIQAGRSAGAPTIYLTNGDPDPRTSMLADFTVARLEEVRDLLRFHTPLPTGKLPNDLLADFIEELGWSRGDLLVAPGMGEDAAAVALAGEEVLVLKSDPVTFATDAIGYYAVVIGANDIATCGAVPRWLLTALLFPPDTCAADVRRTMHALEQAARAHGMRICGGHTEITDAVRRPVIVAQAAGTVSRAGLIEKKNMRTGDRILLTKGIAVEGTSILAREFPALLRRLGVGEELLDRCRAMLHAPGISVLEEAGIAAESGAATAMHDVTEGGLATALEELGAAGGHRLRVYRDRIPVLPETKHICDRLEIDPLGLIGSGSLLIACARERSAGLLASLRASGIEACCIGEVLESGCGIEALSDEGGSPVAWPHFEADEIARVFGKWERSPILRRPGSD